MCDDLCSEFRDSVAWASTTKPGQSRKIKKWSWLYHWTE